MPQWLIFNSVDAANVAAHISRRQMDPYSYQGVAGCLLTN